MNRRPLGSNGPDVSTFGLGTMTFGVETAAADAHAQLDLFVERGGTVVDTADVYGDGESERFVGGWLASRRPDSIVLCSKGRFGAPVAGESGASPATLRASVEASLDRLGVGRIDVYYVHGWDQETPVDESLGALSDLVRAGLIGAIGWSNTTGWQLQRILTAARLGGHVVPTAFQPQVQPARSWCRVGGAAVLPGGRSRRGAVVASGWRLAHREVRPREPTHG